MPLYHSKINTKSESYIDNHSHHLDIRDHYRSILDTIKKGGGEKAIQKHHQRNKNTARERIEKLLDMNSPFLELSSLAAYDCYEFEAPCAGIITGIGLISQHLCMIIANDATVKGGTYFPLTVKKHLRAQEIAQKHKLICLYLVDSGGAYLPLQSEVFPDKDDFGRIFFNQAQMSAQGIPQIAVVLGSCTAGGAYIPSMADESIIVKDNGTIFLGGPPLVKAATGEVINEQDLGGAKVHTALSGVADHFAENEEEAFHITKTILDTIPHKHKPSVSTTTNAEPYYKAEEIYGVISKDCVKTPFEAREIICRLVDRSEFSEFKENYGITLVCAFAKIHGFTVGLIANNGILFSESALKGCHFIQLCCKRNIPIIFLQNITGFMIGSKAEHSGIAKHGAKMVMAVANAKVPKFTIVMGGSFGAGNYGMCGRAYEPDFLWMWPNAKISVMGGEQAANVLTSIQKSKKQNSDTASFRKSMVEKFERESNALYSSARIWDDGILEPEQTRDVLGLVLAMAACTTNQESTFGIFRM